MIEYLELGSTPSTENCVQVDKQKEYLLQMLEETKKYKDLLEEVFDEVLLPGMRFELKKFTHEFGCYYEVVIDYNCNDEKQEERAFFIEDNLPDTWNDNQKRKFIGE